MKTKNKILFILFLFIILFFIPKNKSFAADYYPYEFTTIGGKKVFLTQNFLDTLNCTSFAIVNYKVSDTDNNRFTIYAINNEEYPNIGFGVSDDIRWKIVGYDSDYVSYSSVSYFSLSYFAKDDDNDGIFIFDGQTLLDVNYSTNLDTTILYDNTSVIRTSDANSYINNLFNNNTGNQFLILSSQPVFCSSDSTLVFRGSQLGSGNTDNNGDSTGDSENDDGSSEDSDSSWLDTLWNWFSNIFNAIGNIASNIVDGIWYILDLIFRPLIDFVGQLVDYLLPGGDEWFVTDLLSFLGELLKNLFIPEENFFSDNFNDLKDDLNDKIPLYDYLDSLEEIEEAGNTSNSDIAISVDLENYNLLDKAKLNIQNFIDFSILNNYKDTWFAWVRVFTYVALVIYHINEIIKFLRGFNLVNSSGKEPTPVGTGFYMSDGSRNPNFKGFGKGD